MCEWATLWLESDLGKLLKRGRIAKALQRYQILSFEFRQENIEGDNKRVCLLLEL